MPATASFTHAIAAAREAAGLQHYPEGALYVVATPIGNLADITLRALHVLATVDLVACEDTRHTQALLHAYGFERPRGQLLALHQHNEASAADDVVTRLAAKQRIAYVSDAGTPAVSDPGARLVDTVRAAGYRVLPLPGASSVTALLSAAGLCAPGDNDGAFVFIGFLPSKAVARAHAVQRLTDEARAVLLLEAPHRIQALAQALAVLGERRLTIGRELTKQFEDIVTLPARELANWLGAAPERLRGEFVLALHPLSSAHGSDADTQMLATSAGSRESERVLRLLLTELPLKSAVHLAAQISGAPRNALYQRALEWRSTGAPDAGARPTDGEPQASSSG